ncbi:MAG: nitroreductase family protein [Clostridia bacterium]|nr:nitroreductase family protein [Clostridia bacterium]
MNFSELALTRQSCRSYDKNKEVEQEKLDAVLSSARLAPSACNSQPYKITVCKNDCASKVAEATMGMGMNKFTADAPIMIVISEGEYSASAALGAKLKANDYRSIDIGILASYITLEATAQGLGTCILGWFDDKKIRKLCSLNTAVRLVISLGYPSEADKLRTKKRKNTEEFIDFEG